MFVCFMEKVVWIYELYPCYLSFACFPCSCKICSPMCISELADAIGSANCLCEHYCKRYSFLSSRMFPTEFPDFAPPIGFTRSL